MPGDIRDIKPPVQFPVNHVFLIALLSLLAAALIFFLVSFIARKIKEKRKSAKSPPKTAYEIACQALKRLKDQNLPGLGKIKEYYFGLSDIVRRYIENRFNIRAPEMTTEEFLFSLRQSGTLTDAHKSLLKSFLNLCDVVKFAKYGPSESETEESFDAAKKFTDETK